jgi:hypothetical protein
MFHFINTLQVEFIYSICIRLQILHKYSTATSAIQVEYRYITTIVQVWYKYNTSEEQI